MIAAIGAEWLAVPALVIAGLAGSRAIVKRPGQSDIHDLAAMAPLPGRTYDEIEAVAGQPLWEEDLPGGRSRVRWLHGGFRITLDFDASRVCTKVERDPMGLT